MNPPIAALNPKPIHKTTTKSHKSALCSPKLVSKTSFPKTSPEGTRLPKRKPGQGELRRSFGRTSQSVKPKQVHKSPSSTNLQLSQPQPLRESAELERRFRNLELGQKDLVEQTRIRGELEYLAVAKNGSGRYWITVAGTGKPFVRKSFTSTEFCWECSVEIEENFEVGGVIELRPPETMERIEEIIISHKRRESVATSDAWTFCDA